MKNIVFIIFMGIFSLLAACNHDDPTTDPNEKNTPGDTTNPDTDTDPDKSTTDTGDGNLVPIPTDAVDVGDIISPSYIDENGTNLIAGNVQTLLQTEGDVYVRGDITNGGSISSTDSFGVGKANTVRVDGKLVRATIEAQSDIQVAEMEDISIINTVKGHIQVGKSTKSHVNSSNKGERSYNGLLSESIGNIVIGTAINTRIKGGLSVAITTSNENIIESQDAVLTIESSTDTRIVAYSATIGSFHSNDLDDFKILTGSDVKIGDVSGELSVETDYQVFFPFQYDEDGMLIPFGDPDPNKDGTITITGNIERKTGVSSSSRITMLLRAKGDIDLSQATFSPDTDARIFITSENGTVKVAITTADTKIKAPHVILGSDPDPSAEITTDLLEIQPDMFK